MINLDKFTIVSYDQISGFDRTNGSLVLIMDELSDFSLAHTEEKSDITGKAGRVIGSLKKNKSVTGSGTNGLLSGGALAAMVGGEIVDGDKLNVHYTDVLTVQNDKATTTLKAIGTAGNEIGTVYVPGDSGAFITDGTKLTQAASAGTTGTFAYDPDTKELSFHTNELADGTQIYVFYTAEVEGKELKNDANKFSKTLALYVDCTCQDACDNQFHGQFIIERADFSGSFTLQGGTDPATQGFEFTTLPNLCTGKTDLWDFIVFD
ncbi:MAG: hypothetical protein HUJ71_05690 [Pseudobutyrivibrio sp.]|nr:hypothetical protein [Pseudobutyrivibrio sp.]